jgi:RTA1 like protein
MSSSAPASRREGSNIIVGGLFLQITFFGLFVITALFFHLRLRKNPTPRAFSVPYQKHLGALYATSILIFMRSIVRVVEFLQGFEGFIIQHEVFLYVFDGVLMLIAMLIFNWIHPSEVKSLLRGGKAANGFRLRDTSTA